MMYDASATSDCSKKSRLFGGEGVMLFARARLKPVAMKRLTLDALAAACSLLVTDQESRNQNAEL